MDTKTSRRIFKPLVFIASLLPFAYLLYALYSDTVLGTKLLTDDPVQKFDRELGDWTLIFIIITLSVRPLADILKKRELIAYRRMLGLFAFFYGVLHVSSYVGLNLQLDFAEFVKDVVKRPFITVGIIAFTAMAALAATSTKGMIKRMGARAWTRLHWLIYPIAVLGVVHFYMMIRADFSRPVIYGSIIFVLLAYRYVVKLRRDGKRKRRDAETAAA